MQSLCTKSLLFPYEMVDFTDLFQHKAGFAVGEELDHGLQGAPPEPDLPPVRHF